MAPFIAHADQRGRADDGRFQSGIAPGVPGDGRDLELAPRLIHRDDERDQRFVLEPGRQEQAHRRVGGGNAGGPEIGSDEVAGEPRRDRWTERGNQRQRIGGDRQHPSRAEAHDRGVGAGARADQDFGARRAEAAEDRRFELTGRELAEARRHGGAV